MRMILLAGVFVGAASSWCAELPNLEAVTHDGRRIPLVSGLLRGRPAAIQFVFTDCPTACPLLGALFASVDKRLRHEDSAHGPILITVSVNPERDTPSRLAEWRQRFGASDRWVAIRLDPPALRKLQSALGERGGPPSAHSTDLFLFDRTGAMVNRLTGLPSADSVAEALRSIH